MAGYKMICVGNCRCSLPLRVSLSPITTENFKMFEEYLQILHSTEDNSYARGYSSKQDMVQKPFFRVLSISKNRPSIAFSLCKNRPLFKEVSIQ